MLKRPALLVWWAVLMLAPAAVYAAPSDEDCMACHSDPNLTKDMGNGVTKSMYLDAAVFTESIHGAIGCVACHADIVEVPHDPDLKPVNCGECHAEAEAYTLSLHGKALASGDKDVGGCIDCHGKHDTRAGSDPLSMTNPRNLAQTCGRCHSDAKLVKTHMVSISEPSESYLKGVHAKAIAAGNDKAAVCSDCHGAHEILPSNEPNSPIARAHIHQTCGKCHEKEMAEFNRSIHGRALEAGIKDAPTCIDCHGEHDIEPPKASESALAAQTVSRSTCPKCHEDETVMKKYGITTHLQASYMDSYHGMYSVAGGEVVASCASCHGAHEILPQDDPASSINPANVVKTCSQCHENATANFAASPVHVIPTDPGQRVLGFVRVAYIWLIVVVLGGMVAHNMLLMGRHMVGKLREELHGADMHRRFSPGQTLGHLVLMITFIVLAISGFALRYPDNYWLKMIFFNGASIEMRSTIHRWAGAVLIALLVLHAAHALFTRKGRREMGAFLPKLQDVRDAFANIGYAIGLRKRPPTYDRFGYAEKLEYWGLMWGSVLMGVTGLCMWFAEDFMRYFSKLFLDIAATIHYYEAWLAVGTILVWHMYFVIFDPHAYPMNFAWLTGRITEEEFKKRHAKQYEREQMEAASTKEAGDQSMNLATSTVADARDEA
ncbi:MAG: cytochrome b/b6 domain-containing protein [Candidatus Hydrogenedentes bacterium]|nr:cytochrome b/b6 domain-containing protein [Candidatus Hydrogenedentota bacterium]